jgi:hypothetical protein
MHEIYNQFTSNMFGKGTDCKSAPAGGVKGGFIGTGIGGAVSWVEVAYGMYRTNPISLIVGYGTGSVISLRSMEIRMMNHDRHVEHKR